jgi:hypothetical protein
MTSVYSPSLTGALVLQCRRLPLFQSLLQIHNLELFCSRSKDSSRTHQEPASK